MSPHEVAMEHDEELALCDEHFERIKEATGKYMARKPHSLRSHYDYHAREFVFRVRIDPPPPPGLRSMIGAVLGTMRTSLEYLAMAVVEFNGVPAHPKRVQFPIFLRTASVALFASRARPRASVDVSVSGYNRIVTLGAQDWIAAAGGGATASSLALRGIVGEDHGVRSMIAPQQNAIR